MSTLSASPSLSNPNILYQLHHFNDDISPRVYITSAVFVALAVVAVSIRFLSRRIAQVPCLWDDWTILAALFLYIIQQSIEIDSSAQGYFGRHTVVNGVHGTEVYLRGLFAYLIVYPLGFPLTKVSACLFYLRIFPSHRFRIITKITIVVLLCWIFGTVMAVIFQCSPVSFFWKQAVPGTEGKCFNLDAFYYACTGNNIVSDLWVLFLPVPLVWRLQVSVRKRLAICSIFLLGTFVTLISVVRIFYIAKTLSTDPSFTGVQEAIWTNLEGALGLTCACLPSYGPVISHIRKSYFGQWVSKTYSSGSDTVLASIGRRSKDSSRPKGSVGTETSADLNAFVPGRISVRDQVDLESRLVPRKFDEIECECGRKVVVGFVNNEKTGPRHDVMTAART